MVVDYEAAWVQLTAFAASKSQHGREGLLTRMAEITESCQVPAGELSRLLRLHGVEVERARSISSETRDELGPFAGGLDSPADAELPEHHRTEEVHDGAGSAGHHSGARNGHARRLGA